MPEAANVIDLRGELPHIHINEIEAIAQGVVRIWGLRTKHSLKTVLTPGYFNNRDIPLSKEDRIELVSNSGEVGDHATLVVDSIDKAKGVAKVSLLHLYKRAG